MDRRFRFEQCVWLVGITVVAVGLGGCFVPQVAMTPRERGDSMVKHGFYDAGVEWYTRAIRENGNDFEAYSGRARARSHMINLYETPADKPGANLTAALADLDRAIELAPKIAQLRLNRGVVRSADGQLDLALADMDEAGRLDPSDSLTHGYRGLVLLQMGRDAEAQREIDQCLREVPWAREEMEKCRKEIAKRRAK
jgi:tetratricopeptide (TPR) repeat protein